MRGFVPEQPSGDGGVTDMAIPRTARFPASGADVASAALGRSGWPLVVAIWAAFALWRYTAGLPGAVSAMSTDDAMRLAQVRDLMGGQGWFDLTQTRLNPPEGVVMHWSRLVDLPIAATLGLAERALDGDAALKVMLAVWPALLFLAALLAGASAAAAVAGPAAGALSAVLFLLSPGVKTAFGVGAIDHHGAQIVLTLTMIACALRLGRSGGAAIGAGLSAAAMMAIGMETAPLVAVCAGAVALRWAVFGDEMAPAARRFGLAFAGGAVLAAAATVPPDRWAAPVCDALAAGHLAVAVIGGVGLAVATLLDRGGLPARFAALAMLGTAVVAGVAVAAPDCLASPYAALPERLKTEWLASVQEAHSFASFAAAEPASALAIGLAMLGALAAAAGLIATTAGETRLRVVTVSALLAAAVAVTLWQIRGASLAFAIGGVLLPAAALAVGRTGGPLRLMIATVALAPMTLALVGLGAAEAVGLPSPAERSVRSGLCPVADYRALDRAAPRGRALNTIDTGPFLLAHTRLGAIAAPYHRNVDGITAALDAFGGSEGAARAVAASRRADLVVVCTSDGGVRPAAEARPDGFSAALLSGSAPDWLTPLALGPDAKLKAWRVTLDR
jgi:hypothetical protein